MGASALEMGLNKTKRICMDMLSSKLQSDFMFHSRGLRGGDMDQCDRDDL